MAAKTPLLKVNSRKFKLDSKGLYLKKWLSCVHVLHSRVTRTKKCPKKRESRAKSLFCQSKPIAYLPFSLPSPSTFLKFPILKIHTVINFFVSFRLGQRTFPSKKKAFNQAGKCNLRSGFYFLQMVFMRR